MDLLCVERECHATALGGLFKPSLQAGTRNYRSSFLSQREERLERKNREPSRLCYRPHLNRPPTAETV